LIPIHFAESKSIPDEIRPGVLINVEGFNPTPVTPLVFDQLALKEWPEDFAHDMATRVNWKNFSLRVLAKMYW
jgi:hypothetical protein